MSSARPGGCAPTSSAGILSVIESAAGTDAEIAQVWQTLQDQRRYGMGAAAADFERSGVLRPGLGVDRAADVLWFLTGPWAFRQFVGGRGWDPEAYEQWMAETLVSQLLPT